MENNKIFLYVSGWGLHGGAPGLGLFTFNTATGAIEFVKMLNTTASFNCSMVDKEKQILYVCNEEDLYAEMGYNTGRVYGFKLDPATGETTELFRKETLCPNPSYLNTTADGDYMVVSHHSMFSTATRVEKNAEGKYVPVVDYHDSTVAMFPVKADGTLDDLVDVKKHTFHKPLTDFAGKPTVPHPHCVTRSPSGKLLAVCDKGDGCIYLYTLDKENRELKLLSRTPTEEPGSEPRYCAFHPTLPYIYVNHEHTAHGKMPVTVFRYTEDGGMTYTGKADCLPEGCVVESPHKEQQGFCISKDGRFLYNIVHGLDSVAVFAIDQKTGGITRIQNAPIEGNWPRGCALSPDGRFLLTACLVGGEIAVYKVNEDGTLTFTGHKANMKGCAYFSFFNPNE